MNESANGAVPSTASNAQSLPSPLAPPAEMKPAHAASKSDKAGEAKTADGVREVLETIVFVVVLVLLLKTYLAEAYVIPTGSMANTLLGYHRRVVCQQCGYPLLVNASNEAEPQDRDGPWFVVSCTCENCRFENKIRNLPARGNGP